MGFTSQAGQVLVRTQTVAGTYNADTGTAGVKLKVTGGHMDPKREMFVPDAEIGGGRDVTDGILTAVSYTADYEGYVRPDTFITLVNAALGDTDVTPDTPETGANTFLTVGVDSGVLPFLSIEEETGGGFDCNHVRDVYVNSLDLDVDPGGVLKFKAGMIAKHQVGNKTKTATPVEDAVAMFPGTNVTVKFNNVTLPAKSFSLKFTNNFEDDDFRLGSFFLSDVTGKRREVTASFSVRESSAAMWRTAVHGLSTAYEVSSGAVLPQELEVTLTSPTLIGATATPYSITITLPNFVLKPYALKVGGDDIIDDEIEGQAIRPTLADDLITVSTVSGIDAVA